MGNYKSQTADSFFKVYDPNEWLLVRKNNQQMWKQIQKGLHYIPYTIPNSFSIEDLQRYEFRYLHDYYLVKVMNVIRMKEQSLITKNENNIVLIQWIVARLSDIETLQIQQALGMLKCVFKGFSLLYSFFGLFDIDDNMIGINEVGSVKVWLNADFNNNQPFEIENDNHNTNKGSNNKKRIIQNILKIFSLIQNKVSKGFQKKFKQGLTSLQSFVEATQYIQKYILQNKINIHSSINIQTMKLLLKHNHNQNIHYYPSNNNHHLHPNQLSSKMPPNQISIKQFNWQTLNRQKSSSNTLNRLKSPLHQTQIKHTPSSHISKYQQVFNRQLNDFSRKAELNKSPKPINSYDKLPRSPKLNNNNNNDDELIQQQQFRRHTFVLNNQYPKYTQTSKHKQQNDRINVIVGKYSNKKIKCPPNITLNEVHFDKINSPSNHNYSIQQPTKIQYQKNYKPNQQHIKAKTMDCYPKNIEPNKSNSRNIHTIIEKKRQQLKQQQNKELNIKSQRKKIFMEDYNQRSKNRTYRFQCPQQNQISKSAEILNCDKQINSKIDYLNDTLVEDLKNFVQPNSRCSSPVHLLQDIVFRQQTVQSEVDQMQGSQELMNKLNMIKIDGLIQQRKRRQTQNFNKFFEPNMQLKQENTIQDIVFSGKNNKKNQRNYKQQPFKITHLQLHKVKSQDSEKIKMIYQNQFEINYDQKKKIKESHDTFYTNNDPYGINAKYEKYVASKQSKRKDQKLDKFNQKNIKMIAPKKQIGEKITNMKKNHIKQKEYFFQ